MAGDHPPDQAFDPGSLTLKQNKTFAQVLSKKNSGCANIPDYGTLGSYRGEPAPNLLEKEF